MLRFKRKKTLSKKKKAYDEIYLWPIFSLYTRFRDTDKDGNGKCITCPRILHWSEGDCGHGISRAHKATKYSEINNNLQCKPDNAWESGARDVYAKEVDKKYGAGTWDKLQVMSRQTCKRAQFEYDTMAEYYCKEVIRLGKEKGIDATELPAVKKWLNRKVS